jgi:hypothetical protein
MITPKEKAIELVNIFAYQIREKEDKEGFIANAEHAKLHAIAMCNRIIKTIDKNEIVYSEYKDNVLTAYTQECYWKQVKQEIEAL